MGKIQRNSNIELLRIVSMLFIVAGHFAGQGGIFDLPGLGITESVMLGILGNGQRIAINIFLMISVWYLAEQDFRPSRIIKVWGEVFLYTTVITVLLRVTGNPVSLKQIIQSFMPFFGRPLWFASAYMSLLMLAPFLKRTQSLGKRRLRALVCILGIIVCILPMFASEMDSYLSAVFWFCFVFIFVGYIKNYIDIREKNGIPYIFVGVLLYVLLAAIFAFPTDNHIVTGIKSLSYRFLHDFKSIPNFIISALLVYGVIRLKPFVSKWVNILAAGSFAVYIVHQTPAFFPLLWKWILGSSWFSYERLVLSFVATVIAVYLLIALFDIVRRRFFEPVFMRWKLTRMVTEKIGEFYSLT